MESRQIFITGMVQGIGFRPFVYRLARELGVLGWVNNSPQGVSIAAEAPTAVLDLFITRLQTEKPPFALLQSITMQPTMPQGFADFQIIPSSGGGDPSALILPDIATCADCLRELFDPANRRYRYPFINCTHCGPRYSIITGLPYDRPQTTMRGFALCAACLAEYQNPLDRRFHAQPTACPACGPHLELWNAAGETLASHDDALVQTAAALVAGLVVAVKGLGGFHLMADARNMAAIEKLRQRKQRPAKPFALMLPDLPSIARYCHVSAAESALLASPQAPIVLLDALPHTDLAANVAPQNPTLGVMLPYTPLHHLLLAALGVAVVATSGNRSDEPICTDEHDALERLRGIADVFLVHNRPIQRPIDDSIVRVMAGRALLLRRARGYAPLPIQVEAGAEPPSLGVGAHKKNTIALRRGGQVFISQHIGDLETAAAQSAFQQTIIDLQNLYQITPQRVAHDLHPDYVSTRYAEKAGLARVVVQHHYAHALACMAENQAQPPALAVVWDGTGAGTDGAVWGGEFLHLHSGGYTRRAHLRPFPLMGGESAIREPRRAALGLLYVIFDTDAFAHIACTLEEQRIFATMLARGLNTPLTTSVGRLLDAVSALLGLCMVNTFEGQAAMQLEFAITQTPKTEHYPFTFNGAVFDWEPAIRALLADPDPIGQRAARWHHTLVAMIVAAARASGEKQIVLSGGCFQNRYLTECAISALQDAGFSPVWHQHVPPNDGGIALGQVLARGQSNQKEP